MFGEHGSYKTVFAGGSGVSVVKLACNVGMSVGGGAAGNRDNAVVSDGRDVNAGGGVAR